MLRQTVQLLVLVCALSAALAARESYTYTSGLIVTIVQRVAPQNCTMGAQNGDTLMVHYTGSLEDGYVFDSSIPKNVTWNFVMGLGQAIQGYELGLRGMCQGEKRTLVIPPALAYGDYGVPSANIPGGATLYFTVQLMVLQRPQPVAPQTNNNNVV